MVTRYWLRDTDETRQQAANNVDLREPCRGKKQKGLAVARPYKLAVHCCLNLEGGVGLMPFFKRGTSNEFYNPR